MLDPRVGFTTLPFGINDENMSNETARKSIIDFIQRYMNDKQLKVIGMMRGAINYFIFKDRRVRSLADIQGLRIRVAGHGIYEDMMSALGAVPIVLPIPEFQER